jgi:hypothetical protein
MRGPWAAGICETEWCRCYSPPHDKSIHLTKLHARELNRGNSACNALLYICFVNLYVPFWHNVLRHHRRRFGFRIPFFFPVKWLCGSVDFRQGTIRVVPTSGATLENVVIPNDVRDLQFVWKDSIASTSAPVGGSPRIHAGEERFSAPKRPHSFLSGFSRGVFLSGMISIMPQDYELSSRTK